jgi:hypothetical protein
MDKLMDKSDKSIDEILKELQGKNLTKDKLFDFLSNAIGAKETKKQCNGCMKKVKTLEQHYKKSPACLKWNNSENVDLQKGIHLIIDELLESSISIDGKLECKFCNKTFVNNGNLHKHFNNSTICNRLAHQEFKQKFNAL